MRCPLCGSVQLRTAFWKAGHEFHECVQCKHVRVFPYPEPEATEAHYRLSYSQKYLLQNIEWFTVLAGRRMHVLRSYFGPNFRGTVLDVGSGYGFFLDECRRRGWKGKGIESSPVELDYSVGELSLDVLNRDVIEAMDQLPKEGFDAVCFWHVLEHLEEPGRAVLEAKRLVKEGGILVLNSPNLDSAVFKLLGARWSWIFVPGHLQYFRIRPFAKWVERQSLTVTRVETWTDAPNLYFMLEESLLLQVADALEKCRIPRKIAGRVRRFVYGAYHQQVIQRRLRALYLLTPRLDRYLRSHLLGHEFLLVLTK